MSGTIGSSYSEQAQGNNICTIKFNGIHVNHRSISLPLMFYPTEDTFHKSDHRNRACTTCKISWTCIKLTLFISIARFGKKDVK